MMATLPRTTRSSTSASDAFISRRQSEFDAGINTSTAWTEHLERASLSDEDPDDDSVNEDDESRPARALYDFEGKVEFRELSVQAGDEIGVLKEQLADGWSLVKNGAGEVGLLPRAYYAFTLHFAYAPDLEIPPFRSERKQESTGSNTPRGSPKQEQEALPIVPQTTGEWRGAFPSFRQSLLGGKSFNRFSSFVTSGAEEWVLNGNVTDSTIAPSVHEKEGSEESDADGSDDHGAANLGVGEADKHFVDAGPTWKPKLPPFKVLVHSPAKCTSALSGAYTIYSVTSLFHTTPTHEPHHENDEVGADLPLSPTRVTVHRRFSHFIMLHTALMRRLPGIALPPLPEKQYAGRFSKDFVEARRGDLERYIGRVVRHPVARYAEILTFFLGCTNDIEFKRMVPRHLALPLTGPSFYAHVFHPAFNLDPEEAAETVERFDVHTQAVGKGVQGLRNVFGRIRDARVEMSRAERLLSYSLLSLITSKPLASAPATSPSSEDYLANFKENGLLNDEGAWCWREGCEDCLRLTKAMQKTSETLQSVADLFDDHARRTLLASHESLKGVAHPSSLYQPVIDTHRSTLSRYKRATQEGRVNNDIAARCETVLNTTMAEMETYHTQKREDFRTLTVEHLDGEIAFYEQVLNRLKSARRTFDSPHYDELSETPRKPSMYERELENPRLTTAPLLQPCPHVFDSAPMRPVSVAIQEGVGMLLGTGPVGRASMFGKFW